MEDRQLAPWVKPALEYGPIIAFFAAYMWLKDETLNIAGNDYSGFIVVTAAFVPLILAATGLMWWLTGKLSKMQLVTAVLVTVFGGLTVWLNDERFIKMKPTIIYLIFGGLLGFGLMRGQSYLKVVMGELVNLRQDAWMTLTKRLTIFFLGLAILNEVIWRLMSTEIWVYFKTFGLTAAIFVFFITQSSLFEQQEEDKG